MQPIGFNQIRTMADELARNALPRLLKDGRLPDRRSQALLTDQLVPAVAAFAGLLMTLAYDQDEQLRPSMRRLFADPATADALARYLSGDDGAAFDIHDLFLRAGARDSRLIATYFRSALDMMIAVIAASVDRTILNTPPDRNRSLYDVALLFREAAARGGYDMTEFVDAYLAAGLARIELGQAIAADGTTVIFVWSPAPMAGAPPDDLPQSAGPDEIFNEMGNGGALESAAESEPTTAEPPGTAPVAPMPPPPAPAPPPPADGIVALRLDAALPEQVTVGRAFDLAVAIRRPGSPPLAPDDLARRESADFGVAWPSGAAFVRLRLQISAPDCIIHGGDSRDVRLPAGQDGPPVYFQLTPQAAGPLSVIITVYQEADWVGSTRLRTQAGSGEARGKMVMTVESRPVGDPSVNLVTLRQALDDGYNDSELRDLCFDLGIDYDDLPGDNQSAKARELVLYAKRRDLTANLVAHIMKDRPHLLAPA